MGQFAEAEIVVIFNDKKQTKIFGEIIKNFKEELTKRFEAEGQDTDFDVNIDKVEIGKKDVRINLSSNRVQNTEWQCDQISDIAKKEFGKFIDEFDCTITTPYGYIWWDADEIEN